MFQLAKVNKKRIINFIPMKNGKTLELNIEDCLSISSHLLRFKNEPKQKSISIPVVHIKNSK